MLSFNRITSNLKIAMIGITLLVAIAAFSLFVRLYHVLRPKRPKGTQDLPGPSGMFWSIYFVLLDMLFDLFLRFAAHRERLRAR